jgi:hypothetical protein
MVALVPMLSRSSRQTLSIAPALFGRGLITTGRAPVDDYDKDQREMKPKKPKRRWMSVTELVEEVEQAMVTGVRLEQN